MQYFKKMLMILLSLFLLACQPQPKADIIVGTIAGPETELAKVAQSVAKNQYGLEVKIMEFSDYNLPNEALADGSLDMNIYQHQPFLKESIRARHYRLSILGKTFIYPMGIYSQRHKNLTELPDTAIIAIPNDPSNQTRALMLLQAAGLISLPEKDTFNIHDIQNNPKHLKIKELDAAQLPRVLMDVDAAVINTTFAIPAGLSPARDTIYLESKDSPYANLMVVRTQDLASPQLNQFAKAMHSQEVINKARALFGESAIPAWI